MEVKLMTEAEALEERYRERVEKKALLDVQIELSHKILDGPACYLPPKFQCDALRLQLQEDEAIAGKLAQQIEELERFRRALADGAA